MHHVVVKQLPWDPATEHYVAYATLRKPVDFFVLSRSIAFTDGLDGLDYYRAALLELADHTRFVLRQHRGGNSGHTDVCLGLGEKQFSLTQGDVDAITQTIEGIVGTLGLTNRDIHWQINDTFQVRSTL